MFEFELIVGLVNESQLVQWLLRQNLKQPVLFRFSCFTGS